MSDNKPPLLGSNLRERTARILFEQGANGDTLTEVLREVGFQVAFNADWELPRMKEEHRKSLAQALLGLTDYSPQKERGDDFSSYNFLVSALTKSLLDLER